MLYCSLKRVARRPSGIGILFCTTVRALVFLNLHCLDCINITRCVVDPALSALAANLITSLVYSHDVVARLSLGSVKDIRNAAMWLCAANDEEQGYASVTRKARAWKEGGGNFGTPDWVC